jgi:hypothetical protein
MGVEERNGSRCDLVLADQKTCPPFLCSFITLITYLFSLLLLPFTCLACLYASLCQFVRVSWAEGVLCLFATPQKGRVDR